MSDFKLKSLIKKYLNDQKLMQVASVRDGKPWVFTVWQVNDEDMNMYFFSSVNRRHSKDIASDGNVSGALAMPHTPDDKPRGLQFEGYADLVTDSAEILRIRELYEGRIFDADRIDKYMSNPENPHAFYRIKPSKYVLFDVETYPDDPRKEFTL